ncbi:MAG: SDR family NAD(P)-dependent oxidoreductase [Candidatus Gastranaerophilaceae bacterium]
MSTLSEKDLIFITGASSGIGKTTILKLNSQKIKCVGVARREEKLKELKSECKYPELFNYAIRDLSKDIETLGDFTSDLAKEYGAFSGFVHCAGSLNLMPVSVWDYKETINEFNIGLFSAFEIIKALSKKKNKQELLNIVLMSSIAAQKPHPSAINYGIIKAAVRSLVIGLTREIGNKKIRINAIAPGGIEGEFVKKYSQDSGYDYIAQIKEMTPFKEAGRHEYVADLITFLLSKESYWIQGQTITIDGAETLA